MRAPTRPPFELSKWYLDAVGESGDVFIGYRANLRWRALAASYAAALTGGADEPRTRSTLRPGKEPDFLEGALAWEEPRLGLSATWRPQSVREVRRVLYDVPEGAVVWRCLMPSAEAEVRDRSSVVRGPGYVEHLSMTLPPWRLPLDTLRWGRFLSPGRSVVWIDWERGGGPPKTWVFVDGDEARGEVSEEDVFFEGGRVRLPQRDRRCLRDGRLSHLLRNLPRALRTSLPGRALAVEETKWRTRGRLELLGAPPVEGWAIHEVVRMRA
jgi:hypothetical protein